MIRKIAWALLFLTVLAVIADQLGLQLPTLRWAFNACREMNFGIDFVTDQGMKEVFPLPAYIGCGVLLIFSVVLLVKFPRGFKVSPITERRIQRFKDIRRGYVAFLVLIGLAFLASLDQLIVGNEALVVRYNGELFFPALVREKPQGAAFELEGDAAKSVPQYRKLREEFAGGGTRDRSADGGDNWVIMPVVPFASTNDTIAAQLQEIERRDDGLLYEPGANKPFNGVVARVYDEDRPERMHTRFQVRRGLPSGSMSGWDESGVRVYTADYRDGEQLSERYTGESSVDVFKAIGEGLLLAISHSNPVQPLPKNGHLLGTTSQGFDVVAYLYGGLQVNFKAAMIYIPIVYVIGISVGLLMGFFGGSFDLVVQRLIEVFSNIPFLFVVIIISESVPDIYKGLGPILVILILFGWMGMTYLMRTAALKEKARDYVASARVIGAPTSTILFKHILPNAVAILVTLIPFSVSGLIMSLTSLDYLGFGLPQKYPTWGRLLQDGLNNLSAVWLATSAFVALVTVLILVTFVGEAIREAFDPKKFTTYQ